MLLGGLPLFPSCPSPGAWSRKGPRWARGLGSRGPTGGQRDEGPDGREGFRGLVGAFLQGPPLLCLPAQSPFCGRRAMASKLGQSWAGLRVTRWVWGREASPKTAGVRHSSAPLSSSALPAAPRGAGRCGAGPVPGSRRRLPARGGNAPRTPVAGVAARWGWGQGQEAVSRDTSWPPSPTWALGQAGTFQRAEIGEGRGRAWAGHPGMAGSQGWTQKTGP